MWPVFVFLKEIIALWCLLHSTLYQENLNVHCWMIFCPDGIIPDSGLTGLNNIYIHIYIHTYMHTYIHIHIYIYIYIYIYTLYRPIGIMESSSVIWKTRFNPSSSHTKDSKNSNWSLLVYHSALCGKKSRVSGAI